MKVTVDSDRCRGFGVCVSICPQVFTLTEWGYTEVENPDVPTELEGAVTEAVAACPEHAIETE